MEFSALLPSPALSLPPRFPSPQSPFSDQSHLQFYGPVLRHKPPVPFFTPQFRGGFQSLSPSRFKQSLNPPQCVGGACLPAAPSQVTNEEDVMKELADLKAQLKLKKKELKAQMKEMKQALKDQKRKTTKAKDCSSTSSSECSDRECESADAKALRQEQVPSRESRSPDLVQASVIAEATQLSSSSDNFGQDSIRRSNAILPAGSRADHSCPSANSSTRAGKIEVCVGGKCKKAGSELLLSSLRGQIPRDSAVEAVPCKCMGNCRMSINVKVQKEETNPLHHSLVGVQDAGLLLSHHFKLGPPPSGLPSLGPLAKPWLVPDELISRT